MATKTTISLCLILFISLFLSANDNLENKEKVKSEKYLKILLRKPRKGYLFNHFYESWLKYSSPENLVVYLNKKYKSTKDLAYLQLLAYLY